MDERSGREAWSLMGVVNATPDSFSDGGLHDAPGAAADHARRLAEAGARFIDIGGESTRPGAASVTQAEELARVLPAIEASRSVLPSDVRLSIDTMKPAVARAAIAAGATLWNDVTALRFAPESLETAADLSTDIVLMHMAGEPKTMQDAPAYDDVVDEVVRFLEDRLDAAVRAGVEETRLIVDPGVGFGKTLDHNLALMRGLDRVAGLGRPVLFGPSRKRFIAQISRDEPPEARDPGTIAACFDALERGAAIFRVHDVGGLAQAFRVRDALRGVVARVQGR